MLIGDKNLYQVFQEIIKLSLVIVKSEKSDDKINRDLRLIGELHTNRIIQLVEKISL